MGCVFLEMATVLNDSTLDAMDAFYSTHGSNSTAFHGNQAATSEWLQKLLSSSTQADNEPLFWVQTMLQEASTTRPTASQMIAKITDAQSEHRYFCFRCCEVEYGGGTQEVHPEHCATKGIITQSQLQMYMQQEEARSGGVENDTVTAQFLEDIGVAPVASDSTSRSGEGTLETSSDGCDKQKDSSDEPVTETNKPSSMDTNSSSDKVSEIEDAVQSQSQPREGKSRSNPRMTFQLDAHTTDTPRDSTAERFSGLHKDRRPLPSEAKPTVIDIDDELIIAPEPLCTPPLELKDCYPLPKATLVPSYILAGTNRFTKNEMRAADPTLGVYNLFVYGRLMFPSAYRGFAARSIDGVYSPMHQRRLVPSSSDWSGADTCIKRAAEVMTPARLEGYDAWRPSGYNFAAIHDASQTGAILANRALKDLNPFQSVPTGEVTGFLIVGLTEESLRYCDLVFGSTPENVRRAHVVSKDTEGSSSSDSEGLKPRRRPLLERRRVVVHTELDTGDVRSTPAYTYVWKNGVQGLWHPWRPESFARSPEFPAMSEVKEESCRSEETSLAKTMMSYALVGDELCAAILSSDITKLQELLKSYRDVDGSCRKFGTPLQAAISKGDEDMVRLLLSYGANPNKVGGKYGTPLIAAAIGGRKSITRLLLKQRADVFGSDKTHVNALYQAVGHGDWAITEMLLEAGAWLSQDYGEVKDLAAEKRDTELQALLRDYDIKDAKMIKLEATKYRNRLSEGKSRSSSILPSDSSRILGLVVRKFLLLSSEPGSWRGRKGVAVTRVALAAGVPPEMLGYLRNALDPVSKLIDMLKAADKNREAEAVRESSEMGKIEELDSDGADGMDTQSRQPRFVLPDEQDVRRPRHSPQPSLSRSLSVSPRLRSPAGRARDVSPALSVHSPKSSTESIQSPTQSPRSPRISISTSSIANDASPVLHRDAAHSPALDHRDHIPSSPVHPRSASSPRAPPQSSQFLVSPSSTLISIPLTRPTGSTNSPQATSRTNEPLLFTIC
jgi:hypothetical protein